MESINTPVSSIQAHNKDCIGCQKTKKDIMIGFQLEGSNTFHDIFLTQEQAKAFSESLQKQIHNNENA